MLKIFNESQDPLVKFAQGFSVGFLVTFVISIMASLIFIRNNNEALTAGIFYIPIGFGVSAGIYIGILKLLNINLNLAESLNPRLAASLTLITSIVSIMAISFPVFSILGGIIN